jgi:uncharacterized integral membrane protein
VSKQTRIIIITVAATLLAVVVFQNFRGVPVRFILWQFTLPLTVVVLLACFVGALIGWFWRRR